jgi:hypothetical protein
VRLRFLVDPGRGVRMGVDLRQRKVAEDEAEAAGEFALELMNTMSRQSRVRAFVVAVLHERDWSVRWTLDMVLLCDRGCQLR